MKYRYWILATVIIISVVLFSTWPLSNIGNDTVSFTNSNASPAYTQITPDQKSTITNTTVTSYTASVVKPTMSDNTLSVNAKFILPLFKQSFAITSTMNAVSGTEWAIPTASSLPLGTGVSSNNLYFTESSTNKIGKLVPSTNAFTEWNIPTASSGPARISVDSIGNVYFTEFNTNKIGRLVPSTNTITEWNIPTASSNSSSIVVLSGNVYFTESSTNKIGKLVPSTNAFTEWNIPTASSGPLGIGTDSAGSLYVTESTTNKIVRLVPSTNTITEWTLSTSSMPYSISTDSAGKVYFTEKTGNNIGRLS